MYICFEAGNEFHYIIASLSLLLLRRLNVLVQIVPVPFHCYLLLLLSFNILGKAQRQPEWTMSIDSPSFFMNTRL